MANFDYLVDSIFKQDSVSVLEYNKVLHEKYGNEALEWDPEVLYTRIDRDFHGWTEERSRANLKLFHETGEIVTDIGQVAKNKIQALLVSVTTDFPFQDWTVFENVGEAFTGHIPLVAIMTPLTPGQCAACVVILNKLRTDEYSGEVKFYIASACYHDGFVQAPPTLKFIQPELDILNKHVDVVLKEKTNQYLSSHAKDTPISQLIIDQEDPAQVQAIKIISVENYARSKL